MSRILVALAQTLLRLFAVGLALLMPLQSQGETKVDKAFRAGLQKTFRGFDVYMADEKDGLAAAILTKPVEGEAEHELRVVVFQRDGLSYQLLSSSKSWKHYLLHRQGWGIQVQNQSILLSFGGSTSCCSGIEQVLRFRKIGSSIRLVGEETRTHGYEGREYENYYETRTSINYLSGRVIHSKRSGPKKDEEHEFGFGGPPKHKEVQLNFPVDETLELSTFAPDDYFSYQEGVPELCGHINEKMKYEACKRGKRDG